MRRGISFVEVLFVAVAVGLVAALLLPIVAQGRTQAKKSTCIQNMQQIGTGIMLYAQDHDDVLPVTTEKKPKRGFGVHWSQAVQPYLRSSLMFICPQDSAPLDTYGLAPSERLAVPRISYINNYAAIPAHDFYPVPRNILSDPGMLIVIGERRAKTPSGLLFLGWKGTSGFVPGQPCRNLELGADYRRVTFDEAVKMLPKVNSDKDLLITRLNWTAHEKKSNYVFADGHAQTLPLAATLKPTRFLWGERFYARSEDGSECDMGEQKDAPAHPDAH